MKAFVAGATGETGRRIVRELVNRQIPVRALVRDAAVAQTILPPEAEIAVGDVLSISSLKPALAGCTVVFCATGARPSLDPTGPYKVDYEGTKNLVDASKAEGIQHFVFVSSLCVSQFLHPLNLFWLILVWKKQAEDYLRQSGLTYTIVRPGGLRNDEDSLPVLMSQADSLFEGSIPRTKVVQVCVEALFLPEAHNKIVEIVAQSDAPQKSWTDLFASIP
jgi:uncharacterized protein YbjT (DUF2867 family)